MLTNNLLRQIVVWAVIVLLISSGVFYVRDYILKNKNNTDIYNKENYGYNEFQLINVTSEIVVNRYFQDLKDKILNDTYQAYKLLSSNSLEQFNSYEAFSNYINSRKEKIQGLYVSKYTEQNNGKRYIVVDQYNNQYTFLIDAVLVYKVSINYSSNF